MNTEEKRRWLRERRATLATRGKIYKFTLPELEARDAQIRREALEEAADEIVHRLGDNGAAAYRILRALAEGEK